MNQTETRIENFLKSMAYGNVENLPIPQSRIESLLNAIITNNLEGIEIPQSRVEEYLYYIAKNGGLGGETSPNPPSGNDWIVARILETDFIKKYVFEDINIENKCLVKVIMSRKKYFFSKDEEDFFEKEGIFTFNGNLSDNTDSNKFCSVGVILEEVGLESTEFNEGYVYSSILKNSDDNYIFNEEIREEN